MINIEKEIELIFKELEEVKKHYDGIFPDFLQKSKYMEYMNVFTLTMTEITIYKNMQILTKFSEDKIQPIYRIKLGNAKVHIKKMKEIIDFQLVIL